MTFPRILEKFESVDASLSYTFSLHMYEWQSEQPFRVAQTSAIGADYAYDHHGYAPAPRAVATENVRGILVEADEAALDTEIASARATCYRIGLGKLFSYDGTTRRWAYARLTASPSLIIATGQKRHAPLSLSFARLSDWFAVTATTGSQSVDESPETFIINNPGDLPVMAMVFRFQSNGVGGFTNPELTHLGNGHSFQHSRTAADADSEVKIDTETHEALWSTNAGSTYADDIGNFTIGDTQVAWMVLDPGDNSMSVADDGTPNYELAWSFYAAYSH